MEQQTAAQPGGGKNAFKLPEITLPKGGGEIRGMGEKFSNNTVTGTSSFSIPLPISPGIAGFQPGLQLQYDSGSGNGPWGLGWTLSLPSVSRRTNKGIPTYNNDTDVFQFTGAEDLVPFLNTENQLLPDHTVTENSKEYKVRRYRPRTEGAFIKIERWTDKISEEIHWRTLSPANVLSIYGMNAQARISDPAKMTNTFQWLLEEIRDNKGQNIVFEYKEENAENIPVECVEEIIRAEKGISFAQKYLKAVHYGKAPSDSGRQWLFHIVFDYGEHDETNPEVHPSGERKWDFRKDAFSNFRAGFEIRIMRLCRRVLAFHDFPELGAEAVPVRALEFIYDENATATLVKAIRTRGYLKGETLITPPLELEYEPLKFNTEINSLETTTHEFYSGRVDNFSHQWADLYGEGMPGLLYHEGESIRFRPNLGGGSFAPEKLVGSYPSLMKNQIAPVLTDLDEDGQLDFFITERPIAGYYPFKENQWESFRALRQFPEMPTGEIKWMDIDGDGNADMLVVEENKFSWYRKTAQGFNTRKQTALPRENDKTVHIFDDARQAYFFADMSGDGLHDLVRVRNGEVCYWPHLGYARFGEKVLMRNAPVFSSVEKFSTSNIRLADLDGSGPSDIIYFAEDHVEIYSNESGNTWSEAFRFSSPVSQDKLSTVDLVDLMGNGTVCIVWTSDLPSETSGLKYIDLFGGKKPRLLFAVKNNMGGETRYKYTSSTNFYREDEAKGQPWITRLPFPVHVVSQIETIDHLTGKRFANRYAYHHGYYDASEKEFRGFGMVEQWDTEEYDWFSEEGDKEAKEYYVPPVFTRTWVHTGAWDKRERFTKQYNEEYYKGDAETFSLEDSIIEGYENFSMKEKREAFRALRGMTLRQEVYSKDGSSKEIHPYTVSETRVRIKKVQNTTDEYYGIYRMEPMESLSINYDRDPSDPRIAHSLQLEHDPYGNPIRSASVVYPRRQREGVFPEQLQMHITFSETTILHQNTDEFYLLGLPVTSKSFELGGVRYSGLLLSWGEVRSHIATSLSNVIPFDQMLDKETLQARLLSYNRIFYWNERKTGALPNNTISTPFPPLVHHEETAAFGIQQFKKVFAGKATEEELLEGGYKIEEEHAWVSGPVIFYNDQRAYYLPYETRDVFGNPSKIVWDKYLLMPVSAINALESIVTGVPDYHTLSFSRMIDINGTISEAVSDALGQVIASTMYGDTLGKQEGDLPIAQYIITKPSDLDEVVENPHKFLQGATTYFWNDLWAYYERKEAPSAVSLRREMHVHSLESGISTVQISIQYAGGEGGAQSKIKVESGPAFLRNEDGSLKLENGKPVLGESEIRWLSSGRAVLNNKGKAVKQYEPFYSTTHHYESERELTDYGITPFIHYDAIGRVIRTDFPDGTFSHVEFNSWQTTSFDPQDNVLQSQWYIDRGSPDPNGPEPSDARQRAAWLAAKHANTPVISYSDSLGRVFRSKVLLEENKKLVSLSTFDITGAPITQTDARQVILNASREEQCVNFRYINGMGTAFQVWSADAGEGWTLPDALGRTWKSWNNRDLKAQAKYDVLNRPVQTIHTFEGRTWTSEYFEYGEGEANAIDKNFRGRLIRHYHAGGLNESLEINFKGEPTKTNFRLVKDYKNEPDWSSRSNIEVQLETADYISINFTDALGRVQKSISADNSVVQPEFYSSGLLKSMRITPKGNSEVVQLVKEIRYNEKGQRKNIRYGNDVLTTYTYDPLNYRILNILTKRSNGKLLQDLNYSYDTVGNITTIYDGAQQAIFNNNQEVLSKSHYTYDAIYRLVKATGREHKALHHTAVFSNGWQNEWLAFLNPQGNPNDPNFISNYSQQYTYDDAGNLTELKHVSNNSYTRKMQVSLISNRAVLQDNLGSRTVDSFFDVRGNLQSMEHIRSLTWNSKDQLKNVILVDRQDEGLTSDAEYYVYGADGNRIRKVTEFLEHANSRIRVEEKVYLGLIEISRTSYRNNSNNMVSTICERYSIHGMDDRQRVAMIHYWTKDDTSTNMSGQIRVHYQLNNHLGSSSMEVDSSKDALLISYEEYYPYGETAFQLCRSQAEVKWKQYRYTGMERDEYSGLNYHSARYYAPWIARWLNPDPAGTVDGLNLYLYVTDNPIVSIDPTGNNEWQFGGRDPEVVEAETSEKFHALGRMKMELEHMIYDLEGSARVLIDISEKTGISYTSDLKKMSDLRNNLAMMLEMVTPEYEAVKEFYESNFVMAMGQLPSGKPWSGKLYRYRDAVRKDRMQHTLKMMDLVRSNPGAALGSIISGGDERIINLMGGLYSLIPDFRGRNTGGRIVSPPVWVNTRSGKIHTPKSPFFGRTQQGMYLPLHEAIAKGYTQFAANGLNAAAEGTIIHNMLKDLQRPYEGVLMNGGWRLVAVERTVGGKKRVDELWMNEKSKTIYVVDYFTGPKETYAHIKKGWSYANEADIKALIEQGYSYHYAVGMYQNKH